MKENEVGADIDKYNQNRGKSERKMGLFSTTIATLIIGFEENNFFDTRVSCEYSGDNSAEILFKYFIQYLIKIRWNVGDSNAIFGHLDRDLRTYSTAMSKSTNILNKHGISLVKGQESFSTLTCTAKFNSNNSISTSFRGDLPDLFSVMSVRVFLQYIIDTLTGDDLKRFSMALNLFMKEQPIYY